MSPFAWIELNQTAFRQNLKSFRSCIRSQDRLGIVVKANAYGHGFSQILAMSYPLVDLYYVFTVKESQAIREFEKNLQLSKKRIVLIGPYNVDDLSFLTEEEIEFVAYDHILTKNVLENLKVPPRLHFYFDTGLNRDGVFEPPESLKYGEHIGLMTHLIDEGNGRDLTKEQLRRFEAMSLNYPKHLERSVCASIGLLKGVIKTDSESPLSYRLGLSVYGIWSSHEAKKSFFSSHQEAAHLITPILSYKAKSFLLKKVKKGETIGYCSSYVCEEDKKIAVFPIGYSDGYPWILSNHSSVLIHGIHCKVLGRVSMNYIVVDITHLSCQEEPLVATLLGQDASGEAISCEELGLHSMNYEVVTRLPAHIKRIIVAA